jgi:hypothetical protein
MRRARPPESMAPRRASFLRRVKGASLTDGELLAAEYPNRGFDATWRFQVSFGSEFKRLPSLTALP